MNSRQQELGDLALRLVQGKLSSAEKQVVQDLILHDPEFLRVLQLEVALAKNFTSVKQPISGSMKSRVYTGVTGSARAGLYMDVFRTVLKKTLPQAAQPAFKLIERSVFANG
ncbi:MAG: hypothetical protein GX251_00730 [Firmicutes bacterium]|nr:hypothetical protein [Bacillota bacterium]